MDYQAIIFERKDGIAYVTLNRPEVLNARNRRMREELIDAVTAIRSDPEVRVVILTGAGERSFSAGRDLKEAAQEKVAVVAARQAKMEIGDTELIARLNKPVTLYTLRHSAVAHLLEKGVEPRDNDPASPTDA